MKAFSFQERQALQVATAVAEEVENNSQLGWGFCEKRYEFRPVLLSVSGMTFRFEGGIVVKVHLVDLNEKNKRLPCEFVVTHVEIRFRPLSLDGSDKISETWGADKLSKLKERRPWWHPNVVELTSIKGVVGIFVDNASGEGYISVDPERNQEGHYTMYETVEYCRFVEGDLGRAKAEAREKLSDFLI